MEPLSDPGEPPSPRTPTDSFQELGELPECPPSPYYDTESTPRPLSAYRGSSIDPLTAPILDQRSSTSAALQQGPGVSITPIIPRFSKRTPISPLANERGKRAFNFDFGPQTQPRIDSDPSNALVLEARDLLVKAYSATRNRERQTRLLDLLEIFREYTEHGRTKNTSFILASQVANLEAATRKIEYQARQTAKPAINKAPASANPPPSAPAKQTTWAKVAHPSNQGNQGQSDKWTDIRPKGRSSASNTSSRSKDLISSGATSKGKGRSALTKRCTLLQARNVQANPFSSIKIRDSLNHAFKEKGIQELVISTVTQSLRGNLVVTTTPNFSVEFLLLNELVIKGVLPFVTGIQRGEPWYKVAIHGIPIREFNTVEGLNSRLVAEEITTFNKGLTPVGHSYWATSKEKRDSGLVQTGTIIVAFPTQEQAKRAINNRLYIAGISAKVAKHIPIPSTTQCTRCAGYGHAEALCKRPYKCILCAENHTIKQHACKVCNSNNKCIHLNIKCANCDSTTHTADSKLCEVYEAIKNRATNLVPSSNTSNWRTEQANNWA
jgi:hypothetical protein